VLSVRLALVRSDSGLAVRSGTIECSARVRAKALPRATRAFRGRFAVCTWRVPATARRATIQGTIAVRALGRRLAQTFAGRVAA